ncbi:unnamed protein product [Coffea canephora]|uniref:Uncharacterized protein n=1 Tax=Coffea canephora TaxID=49390 RepID=A0A068TYG0_COFCA|nr:unnamed protein product [Coffea canephora]
MKFILILPSLPLGENTKQRYSFRVLWYLHFSGWFAYLDLLLHSRSG